MNIFHFPFFIISAKAEASNAVTHTHTHGSRTFNINLITYYILFMRLPNMNVHHTYITHCTVYADHALFIWNVCTRAVHAYWWQKTTPHSSHWHAVMHRIMDHSIFSSSMYIYICRLDVLLSLIFFFWILRIFCTFPIINIEFTVMWIFNLCGIVDRWMR